MNQIGFYHGIKKMSSMTNKSGVMNVFKEATRELGKSICKYDYDKNE